MQSEAKREFSQLNDRGYDLIRHGLRPRHLPLNRRLRLLGKAFGSAAGGSDEVVAPAIVRISSRLCMLGYSVQLPCETLHLCIAFSTAFRR